MEERRHLTERLEDVLVDVIESGNLDSFSNYLLDVSSLTLQLEFKMITEEEFAFEPFEYEVIGDESKISAKTLLLLNFLFV